MQDIKFRGMTVYGKWKYGLVAYTANPHLVYKDYKHPISNRRLENEFTGYFISEDNDPFAHPIRPDTIGQFTGRKDNKGKNIYEGDIAYILCAWWYSKCTVVFVNGCFCFILREGKNTNSRVTFDSLMRDNWDVEVAGNIHENPELL